MIEQAPEPLRLAGTYAPPAELYGGQATLDGGKVVHVTAPHSGVSVLLLEPA